MCPRTARVDDALRNALMIEVLNFLTQYKIFQQRWTPRARSQRVLIGADRLPDIGGQGCN